MRSLGDVFARSIVMDPPSQDIADRKPVWDSMQNFWMDTDPAILLRGAARTCARSKYTIADLEAIYWNEVRPAVSFNLRTPVPEWVGFEINWLVERVLAKQRFGAPLPMKWLHWYENSWWRKLRDRVLELRSKDRTGTLADTDVSERSR